MPTAVALFPKDISRRPREWAERSYNVQQWTEMPRGGHFPTMEETARQPASHRSCGVSLRRLLTVGQTLNSGVRRLLVTM